MKRWEWKPARAGQEIYYYNSCRNFIPEEFAGRLAKLIEEDRKSVV